MTTYTAIDTVEFQTIGPQLAYLNQAKEIIVHQDDRADLIMHDFKALAPPMADASLGIDAAKLGMQWGVHWLLVVDQHKLVGIIGMDDIVGQAAVTLQQQRGIARDQVLCKMLMTPIATLPCLSRQDLKYAQVGHIIETLKHVDAKYLLLTEPDQAQPHFIGLFDRLHINHCCHEQVFV